MSGHRVGIGRVAVEWLASESGHRVSEVAPTISYGGHTIQLGRDFVRCGCRVVACVGAQPLYNHIRGGHRVADVISDHPVTTLLFAVTPYALPNGTSTPHGRPATATTGHTLLAHVMSFR